jgi:hypothetical protein
VGADEWWREIDLCGPYLWSEAVLPGMLDRQQGRIINFEGIPISDVSPPEKTSELILRLAPGEADIQHIQEEDTFTLCLRL